MKRKLDGLPLAMAMMMWFLCAVYSYIVAFSVWLLSGFWGDPPLEMINSFALICILWRLNLKESHDQDSVDK